MRKILLVVFIAVSGFAKGQDSTAINVTLEYRDLEYMYWALYNDPDLEDLYDTIKAKFRVANPPTGSTTTQIGGLTIEFIKVYTKLSNDVVALKAGCRGRVKSALEAVGQTYLSNKITSFDTGDLSTYAGMRASGRFRWRRGL